MKQIQIGDYLFMSCDEKDKKNIVDAVLDLLVFLVAGLQFLTRVIFRRLQLRDRNHVKFCCFHLIPPEYTSAAALRLFLCLHPSAP